MLSVLKEFVFVFGLSVFCLRGFGRGGLVLLTFCVVISLWAAGVFGGERFFFFFFLLLF